MNVVRRIGLWTVVLAVSPVGCTSRGILGPRGPAPAEPETTTPAASEGTESPLSLATDPGLSTETGVSTPPVVVQTTPPASASSGGPIILTDPSAASSPASRLHEPAVTPPPTTSSSLDLGTASGTRRRAVEDPYATAGLRTFEPPPGTPPQDWSAFQESSIRNQRKVQERLEGVERRLLSLMQDQRDLAARVEAAENTLRELGTEVSVALSAQVDEIRTSVQGARQTAQELNEAQRKLVLPKIQEIEGLVTDHSGELEELATRIDFALSLLQGEAVAEAKRGTDGDRARSEGGTKPRRSGQPKDKEAGEDGSSARGQG